jgi:hypothetical protein
MMADGLSVFDNIGARIRGLRQWRGVDIGYVANAIGLTCETVRDIEGGTICVPFYHLEKIAETLRVRPSYFLMDMYYFAKSEEGREIISSCLDFVDRLASKRESATSREWASDTQTPSKSQPWARMI